MTLVGKIFIVLIMIMSILFMAFAVAVYATHQNWRELVTSTNPARPGLRMQVNTVQEENQRLQAEIEQLKNRLALEAAARTNAIAVLETQIQEKEQELQARQEQYQAILAQQQTAVQTVETSQRQLEQLKEQVQQLRSEILTAQEDRDAAFQRVRELTDTVHQAQGVLARLKRRNEELAADFAQAQTVLKANDLSVNTPVTGLPPRVPGVVTAVSDDLIEISLGADDGLREGHTVEVSRRDKYLGRARLTRVTPDRAVGRILPEYRKAPIQRGDRVQTKVR